MIIVAEPIAGEQLRGSGSLLSTADPRLAPIPPSV